MFDGRVCFLPVRGISAADDFLSCEPDHRHESITVRPIETVLVDSETRLRVWRRERVCKRHARETLWQRVRDSDVVLCWYVDDIDDGLAEPRPLGAILQCPAGAVA